jgi:hypothetical protein
MLAGRPRHTQDFGQFDNKIDVQAGLDVGVLFRGQGVVEEQEEGWLHQITDHWLLHNLVSWGDGQAFSGNNRACKSNVGHISGLHGTDDHDHALFQFFKIEKVRKMGSNKECSVEHRVPIDMYHQQFCQLLIFADEIMAGFANNFLEQRILDGFAILNKFAVISQMIKEIFPDDREIALSFKQHFQPVEIFLEFSHVYVTPISAHRSVSFTAQAFWSLTVDWLSSRNEQFQAMIQNWPT